MERTALDENIDIPKHNDLSFDDSAAIPLSKSSTGDNLARLLFSNDLSPFLNLVSINTNQFPRNFLVDLVKQFFISFSNGEIKLQIGQNQSILINSKNIEWALLQLQYNKANINIVFPERFAAVINNEQEKFNHEGGEFGYLVKTLSPELVLDIPQAIMFMENLTDFLMKNPERFNHLLLNEKLCANLFAVMQYLDLEKLINACLSQIPEDIESKLMGFYRYSAFTSIEISAREKILSSLEAQNNLEKLPIYSVIVNEGATQINRFVKELRQAKGRIITLTDIYGEELVFNTKGELIQASDYYKEKYAGKRPENVARSLRSIGLLAGRKIGGDSIGYNKL